MRDENISESEAYYKYSSKIFQTAMPQSSIRPRVMQKVKELNITSELFSIEYVPKTGKNKGILYEQFYKGENFRLFAWLKDVSEEKDGVLYKKDLQGTLWDFVGETKNLTKEGDIPFPNGKKPLSLIKRLLSMQSTSDCIILDFFSGSGTTAHAVMQLNNEDGGKRQFIMIQIAELCEKGSEAYEFGFNNISDLGKERIRRAGKKIKGEAGLLAQSLDTGFRVLKVDSTNMRDVYYTPGTYQKDLLNALAENIKPDRTAEDLLFQAMLDLGILLSSPIKETTIGGKKVYDVADGYLLACFDADVNDDTITEIAKQKPYYAIFRDSSMASDSVAANFEQIFATYSPTTVRKVI